MGKLAKILMVVVNLLNIAAGVGVAVILIFKLDFISIVFVNGITTNESLIMNLLMFQIALVLISLVIGPTVVPNSKSNAELVISFPVIFAIAPTIISCIGIYFGAVSEGVVEKIVIICGSILYLVFSCLIIYSGEKIFTIFDKTSMPKEESDEQSSNG